MFIDIWHHDRHMELLKSPIFFSAVTSPVSTLPRLPINIHFKSLDHVSKYRLFSGKTNLLCLAVARMLSRNYVSIE